MKRAALFVVLAAACGPGDQTTREVTPETMQNVRASLPAGVADALDRGNAAYAADSFAAALEHYTEATRLGPEVAAAWFGVGMAQEALGDTTAARDAMRRARDLAGGASLMHPYTTP